MSESRSLIWERLQQLRLKGATGARRDELLASRFEGVHRVKVVKLTEV